VVLASFWQHALVMAMAQRPALRQLALAVGMTVVLVVAGGAVIWLIPIAGVDQVGSILRNAQAVILFAAASLGLLSGRWIARTSVGFACAALLVLAFAGVVSATSLGGSGFGPVMYTGGAAVAVALLLGAAAAPEVKGAASFRRLLTRDSGPVALLTLAALTPVVEAVLVAGMKMPLPSRIALSALVAAGWLIASSQVLRLDRQRLGWLPAVLLILAAAAVARAFIGVWPGSLLVALELEALAAAFALGGALMGVRAAMAGTTGGITSMLQDLTTMRDEDSRRRAEDSERLHEFRSVLAGLEAARATLTKYEGKLDPDLRRRLQDAVGEELSRLNRLVDPPAPAATQELDLGSVLQSVVMAEREQGLVLTTDLAGVTVQGSAAEVATLVSDLLVNARMHAPGSVVKVSARADRGVVALEVRDWGPGLPAIEVERVFERAFRGTRPIANGVPGSGLGLYTARKLARQMHGDLRLRAPAGGGCCFVVTLPGARKSFDRGSSLRAVDKVLNHAC